ncbi:pseudouridine synthase [Paracidovorax sp. MALMAid1276]|uniref:pseudouridine synthase n=1 Tax=Paracidovorax sp. MALMAid1276 TaxID=3411631 RepID=UPI003B9A977A
MSSSSSRPPSGPPPAPAAHTPDAPDATGAPSRPVLRRPTLTVAPNKAASPVRPAPAPSPRPPRPSRAPAPSGYRTASGSPFVAPVRQVPTRPATPPGSLPSSRLNKRMAELGLCSRREADDWIAQGWVKVNGQVAEMGVQVLPTDRIEVDPVAQGFQEQRVTILLHKPMGYVSGQAEDGHTPAVALINPRTHWRDDPSRQRFSPPQLRGLAPAGRLDIDSVGLLVLTQDGRVARQLIGEDSTVDKEYLVRVQYGDVAQNVQQVFPADQLARLCHGLSLDGQALKPARVEWQNPEQLRFVLTEGKKRQIRRMCELVGLKVVGLKRIRMGRVTLGNLPVGQWRYLLPSERF